MPKSANTVQTDQTPLRSQTVRQADTPPRALFLNSTVAMFYYINRSDLNSYSDLV